ncbi:MAG TPA: alpha-N-arabinofuranosidase, partial [bacterium]|nr:alpha-N-arabinofuranosidase [bacterium]
MRTSSFGSARGLTLLFSMLLLLLTPVCHLQGADGEATYVVDAARELGRINKNIYGHFAEHLGKCIYEGFWVGEDSEIPNTRGIRDDVIAALQQLNMPVLRWPGGCFADTYHWMDGIGPRDQRPARVNMFWGNVPESNAFGTHEFMDLCEQLGAEPYFAGNVGSGTPQEMSAWVEYLTYPGESALADLRRQNGREEPWTVRYWGVGNENWGCGGNMRVEYYTDLYRQFSTYLRDYGESDLYLIAGGPGGRNPEWLDVLMDGAGRMTDGVSMHYYTVPNTWQNKGSSLEFTEDEWFVTLQKALGIEDLIRDYISIMDRYDPRNRVGLIVDEWGTWYDPLPGTNPAFLRQQNTLRDALVAGATLNIFNEYRDRVKMANIAQTVNVLQAMVLTRAGEMVLTPTYHVFEMYKVHQNAQLLDAALETPEYEYDGEAIPRVSASASRDQAGTLHLSLCNLDPSSSVTLNCILKNADSGRIAGRILTAETMNAHNSFEAPESIGPAPFTQFEQTSNG